MSKRGRKVVEAAEDLIRKLKYVQPDTWVSEITRSPEFKELEKSTDDYRSTKNG